jgi:hypothetical protein
MTKKRTPRAHPPKLGLVLSLVSNPEAVGYVDENARKVDVKNRDSSKSYTEEGQEITATVLPQLSVGFTNNYLGRSPLFHERDNPNAPKYVNFEAFLNVRLGYGSRSFDLFLENVLEKDPQFIAAKQKLSDARTRCGAFDAQRAKHFAAIPEYAELHAEIRKMEGDLYALMNQDRLMATQESHKDLLEKLLPTKKEELEAIEAAEEHAYKPDNPEEIAAAEAALKTAEKNLRTARNAVFGFKGRHKGLIDYLGRDVYDKIPAKLLNAIAGGRLVFNELEAQADTTVLGVPVANGESCDETFAFPWRHVETGMEPQNANTLVDLGGGYAVFCRSKGKRAFDVDWIFLVRWGTRGTPGLVVALRQHQWYWWTKTWSYYRSFEMPIVSDMDNLQLGFTMQNLIEFLLVNLYPDKTHERLLRAMAGGAAEPDEGPPAEPAPGGGPGTHSESASAAPAAN